MIAGCVAAHRAVDGPMAAPFGLGNETSRPMSVRLQGAADKRTIRRPDTGRSTVKRPGASLDVLGRRGTPSPCPFSGTGLALEAREPRATILDHSHSIVNRLVPLIGKTGRASAEHRLDTDKSTVAFDGSAHGSFASISGVDRLRQGLDGENGMS